MPWAERKSAKTGSARAAERLTRGAPMTLKVRRGGSSLLSTVCTKMKMHTSGPFALRPACERANGVAGATLFRAISPFATEPVGPSSHRFVPERWPAVILAVRGMEISGLYSCHA